MSKSSNSPRPSLRAIAEACGVSHAMVSRALRKQPRVSAEKRALILKTAETMGYRPDPLVSILLGQVRRRGGARFRATLGWINTDPYQKRWHDHAWENEFLSGARTRAEELGYGLDEFWTHAPGMTARRLFGMLQARNIYGLILPYPEGMAWFGEFPWRHFAVSILGHGRNNPRDLADAFPFSGVVLDDLNQMDLALCELTRRGFRRAGLISPKLMPRAGVHGFHAAYAHHMSLRPPKERIPMLLTPDVAKNALPLLRGWLDEHGPEVIVCADNTLVDALKALGLTVPDDIGVVHVNLRADVADWSGVGFKKDYFGRGAVEQVVAQLERGDRGMPERPFYLFSPGEWIDGWTLGAPKTGPTQGVLRK